MKLATLNDGTRDGKLVVVSKDLTRCCAAGYIAPTLQYALDNWERVAPELEVLARDVEHEAVPCERFHERQAHSPLPRAYQWADGSAYINHVELVRKARGAEPPATLKTDPLVYQGGSGVFLGPTDDIPLRDPEWGLDFESEICVITGDVPMGTTAAQAGQYIHLLMIANAVSLRNLIPAELAKGFGFVTSKPATAFAPFALTPDELGDAWKEGRVHLPLVTTYNGDKFGDPEAGPEMHFSFYDLIAHITKTRAFTAGTILGSGTISNEDEARGVSCLAERRMREIIANGKPTTEFLKVGDRVTVEMHDPQGKNLFGTIAQTVAAPQKR